MAIELSELDAMQSTYKAAVENWIAAIRHEEELAAGQHDLADLDAWGAAARAEEESRQTAKEAKKEYESALREKFFNF